MFLDGGIAMIECTQLLEEKAQKFGLTHDGNIFNKLQWSTR